MPFIPARRAAVAALAALAFLSCSRPAQKSASVAEPAAPLRPLNVVVVTIDTLRADRLHCYGYERTETPTLDSLAQQGALFEHAISQVPLTPPSHASIFTGTYPTVHHVRNTGGFVLQASSRTLAKILQEQGWDTAAFVGAWVLKKSFGFNQGFAVYDDQMPRQGSTHDTMEEPERRAGEVVDRAIAWLNAQSGKPFFTWVHVYDPHMPYSPPPPFREKYRDRLYDGEVAYTDRELGRFFAALDRKSPPEKTLVIVLADHGESLGEHGEYTHGIFLYDSTLHIPLIMRGPGIPAGTRIKQQVRTIDVLPTILALMGGRPPAACQGASVLPALSGKPLPATSSYGETIYPKMNMNWAELRAIRTDRWKYIRAPKPELYDLVQDPGEAHNLLQQHPKEFRELDRQLKAIAGIEEGKPEKIEANLMDQRTVEQLKSLGYLSGGQRQFELNGKGTDPKDRVEVLKNLEIAAAPESRKLPAARRLELLRAAMQEDPTNPTVYYYLGSEYEKGGKYDEAMRVYQNAVEKGAENARLLSRMGDLYLRSGKKEDAIAAYEKAGRLNPLNSSTQSNLGTAYLETGRVAEAERVFQFVLTTEEYAAAYNGLGLVSIQRQDPATARAYFEKAVQLDPDMVEAQLNLGLIYKMAGDIPRARTCFEAFLAKAAGSQYGEIIPKVKEELAAMR
jgi:arylsulfatase A-like enzyme/cytochrome c-type biogenesis protein CcmH/NrfG